MSLSEKWTYAQERGGSVSRGGGLGGGERGSSSLPTFRSGSPNSTAARPKEGVSGVGGGLAGKAGESFSNAKAAFSSCCLFLKGGEPVERDG